MKSFSVVISVISVLLGLALILGGAFVQEKNRPGDLKLGEATFTLGIVVTPIAILMLYISFFAKSKEANQIESKYAVLVARQPSISPKPFARCSVPAVFQLRDGRYIHLMLDASSTLLVGDQGILSWRREEFLQFDKIRFS